MDIIDQILGAKRAVSPGGDGGLTIDLADYGVDVFTMFASGNNTAEMTNPEKLWELVNSNEDKAITLIIRSSTAGIKIEAPAVVKFWVAETGDGVTGLTSTVSMPFGTDYFQISLFVFSGSVVLKSYELY